MGAVVPGRRAEAAGNLAAGAARLDYAKTWHAHAYIALLMLKAQVMRSEFEGRVSRLMMRWDGDGGSLVLGMPGSAVGVAAVQDSGVRRYRLNA